MYEKAGKGNIGRHNFDFAGIMRNRLYRQKTGGE
jgi:hypothetical protein